MKTGITFCLFGVIVGFAGGFFTGKIYFEKAANDRADEEVARMKDYYENVNNTDVNRPYNPTSSISNETNVEEINNFQKDLSLGKRGSNYRSYFEEPYAQTVEESIDESLDEEYVGNKKKKAFVATIDEIQDLPLGTDETVLYYYVLDSVLADLNREFIEEIEWRTLLGGAVDIDSLQDMWESDKYENGDSIFVVNYSVNTCYEIIFIEDSYFN